MQRDEVENLYSWLGDLDNALNSLEGTKALESYLIHCNALPLLEFIWACDGMKNLVEETPSKADDLVSCIYKNYIFSGSLPMLSDQVVASIARQMEDHFELPEPSDLGSASDKPQPVPLDLGLFDDAKREVESHLRLIIFPQFQKAIADGEVYVSTATSTNGTGETTNNGYQVEASYNTSSSRLASHPEAFARMLCEKLEGLMRTREDKPP